MLLATDACAKESVCYINGRVSSLIVIDITDDWWNRLPLYSNDACECQTVISRTSDGHYFRHHINRVDIVRRPCINTPQGGAHDQLTLLGSQLQQRNVTPLTPPLSTSSARARSQTAVADAGGFHN